MHTNKFSGTIPVAGRDQARRPMEYGRPTELDEALALLAGGRRTILAGGTDLYPAIAAAALPGDILDIGAIAGLRGIVEGAEAWRIGAGTTWTDLARATLPAAFNALKQAALEIGSVQIQNTATIVGNLCNASPAADGVPALLILDAQLELQSAEKTRHLPLKDFILGVRKTARRSNELVTAIVLPKRAVSGRSDFQKLGARRYLVISIAMVAARIAVEDDRISEAALAIGSCSAVAQRLSSLESDLVGRRIGPALAEHICAAAVATHVAPIADIRGSAEYRTHAAAELLRRAVANAAGTA